VKQLLNLGCGNRILTAPASEWQVINHDRRAHRAEVSWVCDLDVVPWPLADNSVDAIVARAVLEHLKIGLEESMAECWRILRPGGVLTVQLPLWNTAKAFGDPTHRRCVTDLTMSYFDPETVVGKAALIYGMPPWELLEQAIVAKKTAVYAKLRPRK
jgi:SAM-dependent methyltransferase